MPRLFIPTEKSKPKPKAKSKVPKSKRKTMLKKKPVIPFPEPEHDDSGSDTEPDTDDTVPVVRDKPPGPPKAPAVDSNHCITIAAVKRLCKLVNAKRIAKDSYPTIQNEFKRVLIILVKKSDALRKMQRRKTLMPKDVRMAANIPEAAILSDMKFTRAPVAKCIKNYIYGIRVGKETVDLLMTVVSNIILKWIRSAVGLQSHNNVATIDARALKNVQSICGSKFV